MLSSRDPHVTTPFTYEWSKVRKAPKWHVKEVAARNPATDWSGNSTPHDGKLRTDDEHMFISRHWLHSTTSSTTGGNVHRWIQSTLLDISTAPSLVPTPNFRIYTSIFRMTLEFGKKCSLPHGQYSELCFGDLLSHGRQMSRPGHTWRVHNHTDETIEEVQLQVDIILWYQMAPQAIAPIVIAMKFIAVCVVQNHLAFRTKNAQRHLGSWKALKNNGQNTKISDLQCWEVIWLWYYHIHMPTSYSNLWSKVKSESMEEKNCSYREHKSDSLIAGINYARNATVMSASRRMAVIC